MNNIGDIAKVVEQMDEHLQANLLEKEGKIQEKKLWKNTYIRHQIERRKNGDDFSIYDHICAMVYSMLSSGSSWKRVEAGIDVKTGRIIPIDEFFLQYDPKRFLQSTPEQLKDGIKALGYASQYTRKQMEALCFNNIEKLMEFEKRHGSVDNYYKQYIEKDDTLKSLVKALSTPESKDKMKQMGVALTTEYLRNVGYDIAKPDRHIRRILGSEILACSKEKIVPVFEALDIVWEIAQILNTSVARVDYILWSYCAKGYGEICTTNKPKCNQCVAIKYCKNKEKRL